MSTKSARTRRLPFPIFGIRLKAMLELRRMTQADLARKIGIDIRTRIMPFQVKPNRGVT